MAPREELIASAVTFLQDPSVAASPIEKRVQFLQSKNLTQEEVDLALSRVGEDPSRRRRSYRIVPSPPLHNRSRTDHHHKHHRDMDTLHMGNGSPLQSMPPKRDWRDWFIMATVMGGVGYGLYFVTKRYISPLIAPPTPPQLEQDKENIDEQFTRAFGLIDQLSTDTAALKAAEDARTERLDAALKDVENLVADLKTSSRRRDDETRRISDEVKSLKDAIPKALEGAREGNENMLKELGSELKSLKVLLGNRLGGGATPAAGRTVSSATSIPISSPSPAPTPAAPTAVETPNGSSAPAANGLQATVTSPEQESQPAATAPATPSSNPLSQLNRSASIPAWQMAAANRNKSSSQSSSTPAGGNAEQSAPPS
ncbi:hypothetical protein N7470_002147 [Penicillium chermesinum]|nr:hypothetical protein N7470_002147 [Penicillium chermesinum]